MSFSPSLDKCWHRNNSVNTGETRKPREFLATLKEGENWWPGYVNQLIPTATEAHITAKSLAHPKYRLQQIGIKWKQTFWQKVTYKTLPVNNSNSFHHSIDFSLDNNKNKWRHAMDRQFLLILKRAFCLLELRKQSYFWLNNLELKDNRA